MWSNPQAMLEWAPKTQDQIQGPEQETGQKQHQVQSLLLPSEDLAEDRTRDIKAMIDVAGKTQDNTKEPRSPEQNLRNENMACSKIMVLFTFMTSPTPGRCKIIILQLCRKLVVSLGKTSR